MSHQKSDMLYQKRVMNQFDQPVGIPIQAIKNNEFTAIDLIGNSVTLICIEQEQITECQIDQLWQTVHSEPSERCWTYLPYNGFDSKENLAEAMKSKFGFNDSIHFLIEVEQSIVGWIALLNIRMGHGAVEIGNVYFSHRMKQSISATESIYLLLKTLMQQNFRRIEWKCDDLNQPSKQAALRFGFQFEGVFRQDRISKRRNRNTAWYSILDEEWLKLRPAYEAWLQYDNFDQHRRQKFRLQEFMALYN